MRCPNCKSYNLCTYKTDPNYHDYTHRYKGCNECGTVFQTGEEIIKETIKKDVFIKKIVDNILNLKKDNKKDDKLKIF